jgi:hypothetical protein
VTRAHAPDQAILEFVAPLQVGEPRPLTAKTGGFSSPLGCANEINVLEETAGSRTGHLQLFSNPRASKIQLPGALLDRENLTCRIAPARAELAQQKVVARGLSLTPMAARAWATTARPPWSTASASRTTCNLGILGASVMGTSGAHNPTLTTEALVWPAGMGNLLFWFHPLSFEGGTARGVSLCVRPALMSRNAVGRKGAPGP